MFSNLLYLTLHSLPAAMRLPEPQQGDASMTLESRATVLSKTPA
ncbi:hypothetical protein [Halodesulfovibrio sp.]|jgi:hypothetical protein|nr:hypothetical protein [Halodesulfovibrio sp.]MCT4535205.1 hypothetical protein [Halodesulfovibrio sp.]